MGIEGIGSNDMIFTKTFGTAPNRQLWIQFNSYTYKGQAATYSYWAIVLEETTNKIHIVDQRSSATGALTLGVQLNATTAVQVTGSPTLTAQAGFDPTPADNSYYTFIYGTQPQNDIALLSTNPIAAQIAWEFVSSTRTISGKIQNMGSAAITAFTAKYAVGSNAPVSTNITGVNIASNTRYNFTISPGFTVPSLGQFPLKIWVELAGDVLHANDTLASQINGSSFLPTHRLVMEEATGTWCGWCVRGTVFMDSISKKYPNTIVPIAVHNGDPMTNTLYDAGVNSMVTGYPGLLVGRSRFSGDPSDAFDEYDNQIKDFGMADLALALNFDWTTRVASVTVNTKVAFSVANNNSASDDYRIAVVFTQNEVTGTGATYNQANSYSGSTTLTLSGAGRNFVKEPNPILAANIKYDFVAREILGGFKGMANSLPNTLVDGTTYTNSTFTYTVPAAYNPGKMKVHALFIDAKKNIIHNANSADLSPIGIKTFNIARQELSVYPNPVQNTLNIDLNLEEPDNVHVSIFNSIGEVVLVKNYNKVNSGKTVLALDVSELISGAYFISVSMQNGIAKTKFIK